jgi:hypothetical protein
MPIVCRCINRYIYDIKTLFKTRLFFQDKWIHIADVMQYENNKYFETGLHCDGNYFGVKQVELHNVNIWIPLMLWYM